MGLLSSDVETRGLPPLAHLVCVEKFTLPYLTAFRDREEEAALRALCTHGREGFLLRSRACAGACNMREFILCGVCSRGEAEDAEGALVAAHLVLVVARKREQQPLGVPRDSVHGRRARLVSKRQEIGCEAAISRTVAPVGACAEPPAVLCTEPPAVCTEPPAV